MLTHTARLVSAQGRPLAELLLGAAIDLRQIQVIDDGGERTFTRMAAPDRHGCVLFVEDHPPANGIRA